jgi:hypothetical protein
MAHPTSRSADCDSYCDAANLTALLDILVDDCCSLRRADLSPEQAHTLARIDAVAWASRDLAERLRGALSPAESA